MRTRITSIYTKYQSNVTLLAKVLLKYIFPILRFDKKLNTLYCVLEMARETIVVIL